MSDEPDYQAVWDTLAIAATPDVETLQLGETILSGDATDWRDTMRTSLPHLPLGETRDSHFRMQSVLGQGGMGVVHLAHQRALGRDVAIKTVAGNSVSREAENALLQEARVMGAVEHPNVVPVHIIGQDDAGRPVIVMKRVEGTPWDKILDGVTPLDSEDPLGFHLGICLAVCRAISFAHARRLLHRDIKPANVMIGSFGEVYLLDWGLAVSMNDDDPHIPAASTADAVVGTPMYMAPEMTIGQGRQLGPHTDIFLIGAVLFHALTGEPPNRGRTLFEVMRFVYEGCPRHYPDDVSPELKRICETAMAHAPADRFRSADELRESIESFLAHRNSIELADTAEARLDEMTRLLETEPLDEEALYRVFSEARFGFASALQIWADNEDARDGLQRSLTCIIKHEVAGENVKAARVLLHELPDPDPAIAASIDALAARLAEREGDRQQLEYDYDENVGIGVKKRVVIGIGVLFALSAVAGRLVDPQHEHTEFVSVMFALLFGPIIIGNVVYTQRHFANHRVSRIFAKGLLAMWAVGFVARTSHYWGGVPLHYAVSSELSIFAAALLMLGLAVDRRLGGAAAPFGLAAIPVILYPEWTLELFALGGALSCVAFFAYDAIIQRRNA